MTKHPIPMKGDPLGLVWHFHQVMSYYKMSYFMVFASCFVAMSATAVSSYYLWMDNGIEFLKHHSVTIFLSPWILATLFTETFLIRPQIEFLQRGREHFWGIETATKPMGLRLQRSIKIKRLESIWYLLQCLITGFLCPLIAQICGHIVYSDITYVTDYYSGSKFSKVIFCGILHIAHQVLAFYSVSSYMMLKYIVQSVIIQLYILADFLSQADDYQKNDCSSIREHLKICAAQHIMILRMIKIVQDVCYTPILYLLVCGQLVLLCCSIFLYYNRHPLDFLQIGSILFLSYVLAMDFCQSGQDSNDAFEEFRLNLCRFRWYNWDEMSKKMLLIILSRTQKVETINTLGMSVDRTLMVRILKFAYQGVLIFHRMT